MAMRIGLAGPIRRCGLLRAASSLSLLTVSKAWHRPDEACVGSKFAVMLKANDEAKAA